jgi:hypothetical protein
MTINDSGADKTFVYFLLAYYFHWTPEQVDNTESNIIEEMLTLLPLWRNKEREAANTK